ncbi:MAG: class I SAM-dependent methyltransferase [Candidatus Kariarchaeaceae archaeon]|jgi:ubiquinone/menaquinone biosynthesis C-methylase UbiE
MNFESSIQEFYEEHMREGQHNYFILDDNGRLILKPEQRLWLDTHRKKIANLLVIQSTDCFIDIGCGEGYFTIPLANNAEKSFGFDLTKNAIRVICNQRDYDPTKLNLAIAQGDSIPLPDEIADKLLINHVLEHAIDDDAIIREIYRVLKSSGIALIGIPLAISPQVRLLMYLRRLVNPQARYLQLERVKPGQLVPELIGKQSHIRFYSIESLIRLVKSNGFQVVKTEGVGLSMRGNWSNTVRQNRFLMMLFNILGYFWPAISDGVLLLIRKQ